MTNLGTFFEQTGLTELIIALVSMISLYLGYAVKQQLINIRSRKQKFTEHQLFFNLQNSIREVESWNVPKNKTVFKDALIIRLKNWLKTGIYFADQLQHKKLNSESLEKLFFDWLDETVKLHNSEWQSAQIPPNVIRFIQAEHQNKHLMFARKIYSIARDKYLINNHIRTSVLFETLDTLLSEAKSDTLQITYMKNLNGRFRNDKYKGIPISDTI
jgi:hypothetical protein